MNEEPTVVTFAPDRRVSIVSPDGTTYEVGSARLALFYLAGLTSVRPKPIVVKEEAR